MTLPTALSKVFDMFFEQVKCLKTVRKTGPGLKIQMLNNLFAFSEVFSWLEKKSYSQIEIHKKW